MITWNLSQQMPDASQIPGMADASVDMSNPLIADQVGVCKLLAAELASHLPDRGDTHVIVVLRGQVTEESDHPLQPHAPADTLAVTVSLSREA